LVDALSNHGRVLTEHVGAPRAESALGATGVHDRDLEWLRQADALVAEVTTPSLGVGYEIALAESWGIQLFEHGNVGDVTGSFECALWSRRLLSLGARVEGARGTLTVFNLTGPQYFHRVVVRTRDPATGAETKRQERVKGQHTYWYQLNAFVAAVRDGAPYPTNPADAVANMRVMDASYRAAGLEPRQPS